MQGIPGPLNSQEPGAEIDQRTRRLRDELIKELVLIAPLPTHGAIRVSFSQRRTQRQPHVEHPNHPRQTDRKLGISHTLAHAASGSVAERRERGTRQRNLVLGRPALRAGEPARRLVFKGVGDVFFVVMESIGRGADVDAGGEMVVVDRDAAGEDDAREGAADRRRHAKRFVDAGAKVAA